jgi:hypothetical protein
MTDFIFRPFVKVGESFIEISKSLAEIGKLRAGENKQYVFTTVAVICFFS